MKCSGCPTECIKWGDVNCTLDEEAEPEAEAEADAEEARVTFAETEKERGEGECGGVGGRGERMEIY